MNLEQLGLFGVFLGGAIPWFEAIAVVPAGIILGLDPVLTVVFAAAAKMKFAAADEATDVAKGIVKSLGKNGTVYPAPRAKFLGRTLTTVPRRLRVGGNSRTQRPAYWFSRPCTGD